MSQSHKDADLYFIHPSIAITGRVLFTLIFFLSGITHFTSLSNYTALMPSAIPWRPFWVIVSGVVELAGATLIVSNRYTRLGGWLIAAFLLPVTITVHGIAMVAATNPEMRGIQTSFFLKGLAMTGAALLISQLGVKVQSASEVSVEGPEVKARSA